MLSFCMMVLAAVYRPILWILVSATQSLLSWLVLMLWPALIVGSLFLLAISSASPCEAGWTDWLWGSGHDSKELRQAANLAGESARIAGRVAAAQAEHASEQARQNTQVAEMLNQLSIERQEYSQQLESLAVAAARDSEWAAAVSVIGPIAVCVAVLLVAALVLWTTSRADTSGDPEPIVDLLIGELSHQQLDWSPQSVQRQQTSVIAAGITPLWRPRLPTMSRRALTGPVRHQSLHETLPVGLEPDGMDEDGCPL